MGCVLFRNGSQTSDMKVIDNDMGVNVNGWVFPLLIIVIWKGNYGGSQYKEGCILNKINIHNHLLD